MTIDQFARMTGLHRVYAADKLRTLAGQNLLGSIGNVGLRGGSKAPKLYFLNRSGYTAMLEAGGLSDAQVGGFVKPHTSTVWSPIMAHRVGTIDLLVAAEAALQADPLYRVVATLHEYRRIPHGRTLLPETSDQLTDLTTERIVPDAALVVENQDTGRRGLFFIECDRGTERITSDEAAAYNITDKFQKYEAYLLGGRFAKTYQQYGAFRYATVLFATTTPARVGNVQAAAQRLDEGLHGYFLLSTMSAALDDFFGPHWHGRDKQTTNKPLLKGRH